jgi:3-oxoacyl-[acyl-carrier-protein] synthase II
MAEPIAITGIGIVSPLGVCAEFHFARMLAGDSAIERVDDEAYCNFPIILQGRVRDFDRAVHVPDRMLRKLLSRSSAYALAAATEALEDSGVDRTELTDCGLYVGSVCLEANPEAFIPALLHSVDENDLIDLARFARDGMRLIDPLFLVKALPNSGLCAVAIQHQVLGPNSNITNGAVSGLQAVIAASSALHRGEAEIALAGGYDSLLQMDCIVDHLIAGRLAHGEEPREAVRPYDRRRCGYALSEGAAFFMLETISHAVRRSAHMYGVITSYSQGTSPSNLIRPANGEDRLAAVAQVALAQGETAAKTVDVVFGDALATDCDDNREAAVYTTVFDGAQPMITGFCGSFGFPGAATGVFSLAHALLAMEQQTVPPTVNCHEPIPEYRLNIARRPCHKEIACALVWTSDRGIKDAAVVVHSAASYAH